MKVIIILTILEVAAINLSDAKKRKTQPRQAVEDSGEGGGAGDGNAWAELRELFLLAARIADHEAKRGGGGGHSGGGRKSSQRSLSLLGAGGLPLVGGVLGGGGGDGDLVGGLPVVGGLLGGLTGGDGGLFGGLTGRRGVVTNQYGEVISTGDGGNIVDAAAGAVHGVVDGLSNILGGGQRNVVVQQQPDLEHLTLQQLQAMRKQNTLARYGA